MRKLVRYTAVLWYFGLVAAQPSLAQFTGSSAGGGLPSEQRMIPPAPTTAGLGTYGSLPVDLNAGAVSLNIPLGEVRCRSLALPISLSYRTTGIRVEEVSSWVGLGWSLNAGGLITRTVRGQADETPNTGYYTAYPRWHRADSSARANPTSAPFLAAKKLADQDALNGRIDTEPDTYSVSIAGQSITFIVDARQRIHLNPFREWAVTGSPSGTWEVVLPDGVRYQFEATETTEAPDNSGTGTQPLISAWHLTTIISANGQDRIQLDYGTNTNGPVQVTPVNRLFRTKLHRVPYSNNPSSSAYCATDPPFDDGNSAMAVNYNTVSLFRIRTATTTVEFQSDVSRPDLVAGADAPGRKLNAVIFSDRYNPAVKRRFNFSYQTTSDRLFLAMVQPIGQPAYRFTYNTLPLPLRHGPSSYAQDHWGYFNGQPNCTLLPRPPTSMSTGHMVNPLACANRETNPLTVQAGMLTSVHYPTGGSTYFSYEANNVLDASPARQDSVITFYTAATGLRGAAPSELDPLSQIVYDILFPSGCCIGQPSVKAQLFTLPRGANNVAFRPYYTRGTATTYDTQYQLWRLNDSHPAPEDFRLGTQVYPSQNSTNLSPPVTLPAGTYLMYAATTVEPRDGAVLEIEMNAVTSAPFRTRSVGGVRIRRVVDYAGLGDSVVTTYDYTRYDSTYARRVSSGRLFFQPQYFRFSSCGGLIIAAADTRTLSYAQEGYHIGYSEVSTTRRGVAVGRTTTQFLNYADANARNLVAQETVYDEADHVIRQMNTDYFYELSENVSLHKVLFDHYLVVPCTQSGCDGYYSVIGEQYETTDGVYECAQAALPIAFREKLFGTPRTKDATPIETYRTYEYTRLPSGQCRSVPSVTRNYLSKSEHIATYTKYPHDYAITSPADAPTQGIAELAAKHVLTAVVETQQWRHRGQDSVLVGGELTHYHALRPLRFWRLETAISVISATFEGSYIQNQHFIQDARYAETSRYDQFDRWGNVEEEHFRAKRSSYLWDRYGTHLLAKASQAHHTQIGYTSFEPAAPGRWTYDTTAVVTSPVTGRWSYLAGATDVVLDSLPTGAYILTLWATSPPILYLNGVSVVSPVPTMLSSAGGSSAFRCYRFQLALPASVNKVAVTAPVGTLLDELRLHPSSSQMQSYTHEPLNGMTSQTDATGRPLTYEYDALGRLVRTRDEQGRLLSQQEYHYARP